MGALVKDTLPYAAAVALHTAYFRIAIVVMSLLATEVETGYFATSFRVIEVLLAAAPLVIGAAFPILARTVLDDARRFGYASRRILELALIAGCLLLVGLELGAKPIIDVLGGDEAAPSVPVLRIQSVAVVTTFLAVGAGYVLLSLRRHRDILVANGSALVIAVAATFALVPAFDAQGAAVATVIGEVTLAGATLALALRACPDLLEPLRRAPRILGALAGALAVALLPGLPPVADALLGSLLFVALLAAFGLFPPEVRHALAGSREDVPRTTVFRKR